MPNPLEHTKHEDFVAHMPGRIRRPRKVQVAVRPLQNLEVSSAGVLAEAVLLVPYELQYTILPQRPPHAIVMQDTNEVVDDITARYPLEVESPR